MKTKNWSWIIWLALALTTAILLHGCTIKGMSQSGYIPPEAKINQAFYIHPDRITNLDPAGWGYIKYEPSLEECSYERILHIKITPGTLWKKEGQVLKSSQWNLSCGQVLRLYLPLLEIHHIEIHTITKTGQMILLWEDDFRPDQFYSCFPDGWSIIINPRLRTRIYDYRPYGHCSSPSPW